MRVAYAMLDRAFVNASEAVSAVVSSSVVVVLSTLLDDDDVEARLCRETSQLSATSVFS